MSNTPGQSPSVKCGDFATNLSISEKLAIGAVGLGALTLAAIYYKDGEGARLIRRILERALGAQNGDRDVGDIGRGSLLVKLHCHTAESFLQFLEDYESGKIRERLIKELLENDIKVESLTIEIKNMDEVKAHREKLRKGLLGSVEAHNVKDESVKPDNFSEKLTKTEKLQKASEDKPTPAQETVEINANANSTKTTLFYAVLSGSTGAVERLLKAGADVNVKDSHGRTALHLAAEERDDEILDHLITNNADINAVDKYGKTALFYAIESWNAGAAVERLLKAGADVNVKDNRAGAVLHLAAKKGKDKILDQLITKNADINAVDGYGKTALFYAADSWNAGAAVERLLKAGADVNVKDKRARTALHLAAMSAMIGWLEVLDQLITNNADINAVDEDGKTALLYAAESWDAGAAVERLLKAGADVNVKDNRAGTVLHLAAKRGRDKILDQLITHNADINAVDGYGKTALLYALQSGSAGAAERLLKAGADVNVKDSHGWTPLHLAAERGKDEILDQLITHNADINAVDGYGKTALFYALQSGSTGAAERLVKAGADVKVGESQEKAT